MTVIKNILKLALLLIVTVSFSQCSTPKKLQKTIPLEIGQVYYQDLISDIKSSGSGFDLFIPILSNPSNIMLDSVYFRGMQSQLKVTNKTLYVAHLRTIANQKKDVIMSSEPYAEYGNKVPELTKNPPFKLKYNECVISYKQGFKTKYFKIKGIVKKAQ